MSAKKKALIEADTVVTTLLQLKSRIRHPVRPLQRAYGVLGLLVLLATSTYWAILGARLQASNADQLVNGYMFESLRTFHYAEFPSAHTFLIKWPLFALLKFLHFTNQAYVSMTVFLVLLTVLGLAFVMWRLERRMAVFGTLCLALSSVLLLIPAQPYPGGILPVNMAMITTRNIEYVVFILCLALIARAGRLKTTGHVVGTILLGLLFASDKLFISLSIGGSVLIFGLATLLRRRRLVGTMLRWFLLSAVAIAISILIQLAVPFLHITQFTNQSPLGPYGLNTTPKGVGEAVVYAILAILTNFGANPATDTRLLRDVPADMLHGLLSAAGYSYAVNAIILLACLLAGGVLVAATLNKQQNVRTTRMIVPVMLIAASVAALAAFMFSQHYYPVDSRYLTIVLFAGFVSLASLIGRRPAWPIASFAAGLLLMVSIGVGVAHAAATYHGQQFALIDMTRRNAAVASALKTHPVDLLVGDYWRVMPVRLDTEKPINVLPLASCTQPRSVLTSMNWQKDLSKHSFAYLLSLDDNLTNSPKCTTAEVLREYGRPNASVVVGGSLTDPKEMLLFYDKGSKNEAVRQAGNSPNVATVVPVVPSQLTNNVCAGPTVMNIVAHQDDDLLFMSPDLQRDIRAGRCVRTVYVTAGDAGAGPFYWLSREKGSEAAYSRMLGTPSSVWIEKVVRLGDKSYVTIASPISRPGVTMLFMHLPDGNVGGQGFDVSNFESLKALSEGAIPEIHSVDGQSTYTVDGLEQALEALIATYKPATIRTQADYESGAIPDHSDHVAVDLFATAAYRHYKQNHGKSSERVSFKHYIGYPVRQWPANILGDDYSQKKMVFMIYAKSDGSVCYSHANGCVLGGVYASYLQREYTFGQ